MWIMIIAKSLLYINTFNVITAILHDYAWWREGRSRCCWFTSSDINWHSFIEFRDGSVIILFDHFRNKHFSLAHSPIDLMGERRQLNRCECLQSIQYECDEYVAAYGTLVRFSHQCSVKTMNTSWKWFHMSLSASLLGYFLMLEFRWTIVNITVLLFRFPNCRFWIHKCGAKENNNDKNNIDAITWTYEYIKDRNNK